MCLSEKSKKLCLAIKTSHWSFTLPEPEQTNLDCNENQTQHKGFWLHRDLCGLVRAKLLFIHLALIITPLRYNVNRHRIPFLPHVTLFSWIVGGGHYYCRCSTQLNPTTNGSIVSIMTPGRYAREVLQVCRVSHHFLWHCKVLHGTDTIVVILSDRCDTSVGWNNHYDVRSSLRSFQCNGV